MFVSCRRGYVYPQPSEADTIDPNFYSVQTSFNPLNRRTTQEINGLMNSVTLQIQRAKNDQILHQTHASLRAVNEQPSQSG